MTVEQLIAKLKKYPKKLPVYWSDHDHGNYEVNAEVRYINLVDKHSATERYEMRQIEEGSGLNTPMEYITLRP